MYNSKKFPIIKNLIDKHSFNEPDENKMLQHYTNWYDTYNFTKRKIQLVVNQDEANIIADPLADYCGFVHANINSNLRYPINHFNSNVIKTHLLWYLIYSAPLLPQNSIVYRGIQNEEWDSYQQIFAEGEVVHIKNFLSTSISKEIAATYSNSGRILRIFVEKNTPALYLPSKNEKEILFPPDGYLRLLSNGVKDNETNKIIYDCYMFFWSSNIKTYDLQIVNH